MEKGKRSLRTNHNCNSIINPFNNSASKKDLLSKLPPNILKHLNTAKMIYCETINKLP